MKNQEQEEEKGQDKTAAVMKLCDISTLRILARRLAPDAAAAEADKWRPSSPGAASVAAPQRATVKAAADSKPSAGTAAAKGARPGAPFPEQYVPPPPSGNPNQLPGDPNQPPRDPAQPPAPLLGELNPPKVQVRCHKQRAATLAACQTVVHSALLNWPPVPTSDQ